LIKVQPDGLEAHVVWSTAAAGVTSASYRRYELVDLPPAPLFAEGFED
jgi:hypothetical protein